MKKYRLCRQFGNLYTDQDHEIVREGVEQLPALEQTVVALRFWQGLSIGQIARTLELGPDEIRDALRSAFRELEAHCLSERGFSLSRAEARAAA